MKTNGLRLALAGLIVGAVGVLAACHDYGKKDDSYGHQTPPACEKVAPTPISVSQPPTPAEQAACAAAGGTVQQGGLAGSFGCVLPFCDAGETCSDSADCIGNCYAVGAVGPIGSPATGQCQPNSSPFGCRTEISGGLVGPTLCVD